jgi:hypothetical protein
MGCTPCQLIHGVEVDLLIECEIPSLKLVVELLPKTSTKDNYLVSLKCLDEHHQDETIVNEAHKKHVKTQYDKNFHPHIL